MTSGKRPWAEVSLRPLDAIPPQTFGAWQNDPGIRNHTMGFRFPVQGTSVAAWLEDRARQAGRGSASFAIFHGETGAGACFLQDIDWVNRSARFGIYIGAAEMQGRGIGYCACALALDYAFAGINLRRVELEVVDMNAAAIALYDSLGFVREGVARKAYMLRGQAQDVLRFGLLAEEFAIDIPAEARRFS